MGSNWKKTLGGSVFVVLLMVFFQNCGPADVSTNGDGIADLPSQPSPDPDQQGNFVFTADPTVYNVTSTTAKVTWGVSDYSTALAQYGTTTMYGSYSNQDLTFKDKVHDQDITGLTPATTYHIRVRSVDPEGHVLVSPDFTFTTAP
jgi:hypothetical protein